MTVAAYLTGLDREIAHAVTARDTATARWAHCPSGENYDAVQQAQAALDAKLEQRFAVQ